MESKNTLSGVIDGGAEALLKRGNWKTTVEGWAYWAAAYNTLLVNEGREDEILRLDLFTKS